MYNLQLASTLVSLHLNYDNIYNSRNVFHDFNKMPLGEKSVNIMLEFICCINDFKD